jgi:hypothetical protein
MITAIIRTDYGDCNRCNHGLVVLPQGEAKTVTREQEL